MKNGVSRVACKCTHEQQDKMYGKGVRVANATAKQDKDFITVRCTVCSALHQVRENQVK